MVGKGNDIELKDSRDIMENYAPGRQLRRAAVSEQIRELDCLARGAQVKRLGQLELSRVCAPGGGVGDPSGG